LRLSDLNKETTYLLTLTHLRRQLLASTSRTPSCKELPVPISNLGRREDSHDRSKRGFQILATLLFFKTRKPKGQIQATFQTF